MVWALLENVLGRGIIIPPPQNNSKKSNLEKYLDCVDYYDETLGLKTDQKVFSYSYKYCDQHIEDADAELTGFKNITILNEDLSCPDSFKYDNSPCSVIYYETKDNDDIQYYCDQNCGRKTETKNILIIVVVIVMFILICCFEYILPCICSQPLENTFQTTENEVRTANGVFARHEFDYQPQEQDQQNETENGEENQICEVQMNSQQENGVKKERVEDVD